MSTLAIGGSSRIQGGRRRAGAAHFADLAVLALALPLFVLAGLPLAGYVAAAGAWLAARVIGVAAGRRAARVLAAGDRRAAVGTIAAATLGRVWVVTLAVLLVGLLVGRDDGLAAALLALALVTTHLGGLFVARLLGSEPAR